MIIIPANLCELLTSPRTIYAVHCEPHVVEYNPVAINCFLGHQLPMSEDSGCDSGAACRPSSSRSLWYRRL